MHDPNYCRAQAEFCAEMASKIRRPDYAARWFWLAEQWRQVAEQANRIESKRAGAAERLKERM